MEILINSSCLSLEMRDFDETLITEILIGGFEFKMVSYLNGRSLMEVNAGTLFMLHDEIIVSKQKQVMMGHLSAKNDVITNDDFYE